MLPAPCQQHGPRMVTVPHHHQKERFVILA
jgi:hypothetical protein